MTQTVSRAKTWTFTAALPKPRRYWAERFRFGSRYGPFADAFLSIGPVSFHLTNGPTEGWKDRIDLSFVEVTVRR